MSINHNKERGDAIMAKMRETNLMYDMMSSLGKKNQ